tara:strand:- start:160 stop:321 length:162 start_codon:yes stop_codon:yes gene_type:complete
MSFLASFGMLLLSILPLVAKARATIPIAMPKMPRPTSTLPPSLLLTTTLASLR